MTLWPHQEHVFNLVMSGKNVVLQAPTGSGKTRAALYPFLTALDPINNPYYEKLPHKCIYSVPMRVLAKQFHVEYEETIKRYNLKYALNSQVAIQTGEQPDDRELSANLIFATIDQTLSSFLNRPYSLSRGKGNLNAAAVMASYLVFDEFHLFDPASTLPTTLHMLRLLNGITPFILMTATFSRTMLDGLADALNAVVVPQTDAERDELQNLQSQKKTRRYHTPDYPLSAEAVLTKHTGRSLVICNTVDRARHLYQMINDQKDSNTEVLLLHSRLLTEDRNAVEETIRARFGKEDSGAGSLIVVSTQAIEVGLDITSTALHTELAPANAIIQRAGRCARYQGDTGDVYIYRHTLDPKGEALSLDLCENVNPYASQQAEFAATVEQFANLPGEALTFDDEQAIISAVHGPRDAQIIEQLKSGGVTHRSAMFAVMRGEDSAAAELIRNVFQQHVTISATPDELLDSPFDAPSFGLHPGKLEGYVRMWLEKKEADMSIPWAVKYLHKYDMKNSKDRDTVEDTAQSNQEQYDWIEVRSEKDIRGASLLVVHPALVSYHDKLGFLADQPSDLADPHHWEARLPPKERRSEGSRFGYRLETYEDHIAQVYHAAFNAHDGFWNEMADTAARLERLWGWESGSIRRAAEIAVLLHDVGKLSQGWQGWAHAYQSELSKRENDISLQPEPQQAYAHTCFDRTNQLHREIEKLVSKKHLRPWHAVEGAITSRKVVGAIFGNNHPLTFAVFSAIARHHAPYSESSKVFSLDSAARQHIQNTVEEHNLNLDLILGINTHINEREGKDTCEVFIAQPDDRKNKLQRYLTYLLLVRILRRSDGLGTKHGSIGWQPHIQIQRGL